MSMTDIFVTGTDTEVGKTRISVALIALLQEQGLKTAGMKPVASGCELHGDQLVNEDAQALMQQADVALPYQLVNPYAFAPAIAPHLAAEQTDTVISIAQIKSAYRQIKQQADAVVVEGAGGWLVPLNNTETMADLASALDLPVVLVVAIRLGCINHALLTVAAIEQKGMKLVGWVANHTEPQALSAEIIDSLKQRINAPCLGVVPCLAADESALDYLHEEGE